MNNKHICVVSENLELEHCLEIRKEVFIEEQCVPIEEEIDEYDIIDNDKVFHIISYVGDEYIGTCRCLIKDDIIKIGRVAILKKYRNQNLGFEMIKFAEQYARENYKFKEFYLEAQVHALKFYKNLGYKEYGDVFLDAGIEHLKMKKEKINE